jgi:hypothetical protein
MTLSITYPLTWPSEIKPNTAVIRPMSAVGLEMSPFSFSQVVQDFGGQIWEMALSFPPMVRANAELLNALILELNGSEGTVLMGDFSSAAPRGSADGTPGTPTIDGGIAAGSVYIPVKGMPAGASGYLLKGDYIQLGSTGSARLHKVLGTLASDSSGNGEVLIWPRTRVAYSDDAPIVVENAVGAFRLKPGEAKDWSIDTALHYEHTLTFFEALDGT